jgi:hypothetical protein
MTLRLFPIIPALATMAGACTLSIEANMPEVEVTQHGVKMQGVPKANLLGDVSVTTSFTFSSSNTAWAKRMNSEVFLHQVSVAATGGLPNLDFVKVAHLTMADSTSSEKTTEIASYDRGENAQSSSVIEVSTPAPIDITSVWSADNTVIELQMAGRVPEQNWTVDVTLKMAGKITYKF